MKQSFKFAWISIFILSITVIIVGCTSTPAQLGQPTELQSDLNALPAVKIAGKSLKFEFGGDAWIAKVDGKNFSAGTFTSIDDTNGSTLTLKQTHIYSSEKRPGLGSDIGWVETPGTDIVLVYKKGPPASLSPK